MRYVYSSTHNHSSFGSPNCPIIPTVITSKYSFVASVYNNHTRHFYQCVIMLRSLSTTCQQSQYVHNSTTTSGSLVKVTSLQPGTVYNISVTSSNMANATRLVISIQLVQILRNIEIHSNMHAHIILWTYSIIFYVNTQFHLRIQIFLSTCLFRARRCIETRF